MVPGAVQHVDIFVALELDDSQGHFVPTRTAALVHRIAALCGVNNNAVQVTVTGRSELTLQIRVSGGRQSDAALAALGEGSRLELAERLGLPLAKVPAISYRASFAWARGPASPPAPPRTPSSPLSPRAPTGIALDSSGASGNVLIIAVAASGGTTVLLMLGFGVVLCCRKARRERRAAPRTRTASQGRPVLRAAAFLPPLVAEAIEVVEVPLPELVQPVGPAVACIQQAPEPESVAV